MYKTVTISSKKPPDKHHPALILLQIYSKLASNNSKNKFYKKATFFSVFYAFSFSMLL